MNEIQTNKMVEEPPCETIQILYEYGPREIWVPEKTKV